MINRMASWMQKENSAGIALMGATLLALILSNSFLSAWYDDFLHLKIGVHVGSLTMSKPLYHWVDDGLMAVFFFLIGLEVKREILQGHLSTWQQASLPVFAALGGMVVPALIYLALNAGDAVAIQGWAIPTATDIAFALGVLALLGKRVPVSLKVFLMALAIMDDLGAIVVIALFYTTDLSTTSISVAAGCVALLWMLNRWGVMAKAVYILVGMVLWVSVLKSGVHATLAGVILAFAIPLQGQNSAGERVSPSQELEHQLHAWVAFFILPLFAFSNAGINMGEISWSKMAEGVPLGIFLGLFLGKQLGVFLFSYVAIQWKWAKLPEGSDWLQLYGVALLTGIGFTMSLFISSLAFESDLLFEYTDKLAILLGSLLSGVAGYLLLRYRASYIS